jgi:protein involved in polysaccharide export with SLBB domain
MQVQDLVLQAGGFKEGASGKNIVISRRIRDFANEKESNHYSIVKTIELQQELEDTKQPPQFILEPFDIVSVRKNPTYTSQMTVKIEGQVLYPGDYTIQNKKERLSDIILRTGGFLQDAYPKGAVLLRAKNETSNTRVKELTRQNLIGISDSTKGMNSDSLLNKVNAYTSSIGINLPEAMNHPGSMYDIYVEDGDQLTIPKELQTVKTWGGVYLPKQIIYAPSYPFKEYINQSGGFSSEAYRSKSFVIYANGSVARTRHILFFRHYPRVEQGAEVFVPLRKVNNNKLANLASVAALVTGLTTALFTLIYVSKL